jgi:hypothetical protein
MDQGTQEKLNLVCHRNISGHKEDGASAQARSFTQKLVTQQVNSKMLAWANEPACLDKRAKNDSKKLCLGKFR